MSDLERRLNALERLYERPAKPRLLIVERTLDGRLVRFGADEAVEPRPHDHVIEFALREDGPQ